MNAPRRKPENNETNAARQARLRERRKADGWRRVSVWLPPEHAAMLETLGSDWLTATVRDLLDKRAAAKTPQQATLFVAPGPGAPLSGNDKAARWQEADSLKKAGLSWNEIARRWNAQGRRTGNGAEYRGANIAREVKRLCGGGE